MMVMSMTVGACCPLFVYEMVMSCALWTNNLIHSL